MNYWIIFIGGGLGALMRFGLNQMNFFTNKSIWTSTLLANVLASLIIGILSALSNSGRFNVSAHTWLFMATGFCGGLSTFSTFSLELFQWIQNDKWLLVLGYIALNVVLCTALIAISSWLIQTTS
jgi:CrcB protein